jgi:protein-tyrosine kinase
MSTVQEAMQSTEVEGLRVIAAGVIPPNPAELLGSVAFERLLEQLDPEADVMILDSPPCVPVTDPLIVAARMDAVVLVLKMGQTRKGAIKQTVELLGRARAHIIGTVFNQVEPNRRGYYYYRQYNQYGQGYYGETEPSGEAQRRNGKGPERPLEHIQTGAASLRGRDDDA